MEKVDLSIYIHIPFCVRKCYYCDFLSAPMNEETRALYVSRLCREISLAKEELLAYRVKTVFFGGGTPSLLEGKQILEILECLRANADLDEEAEITIECNPGTVDQEKARLYKKAGINRISLGLQSAQNEELKRIGRIHTYEEFLKSYQIFREEGFHNINIDLMSALPGQSLSSYEDSLKKVVGLAPEHISAYSLIVEEDTTLKNMLEAEKKKGKNSLPSEEEERRMYELTKEVLGEAGYERYEISNYAKSGRECRHNLVYWTLKPYLAFGLGGSSYFEGCRFYNQRNFKDYCEILEKEDRKEVISQLREIEEIADENNQMEEFMFLGLRLSRGVSKKEFKEKFLKDMEEVYGRIIKEQKEQGLLLEEDGRLFLTDYGLDVSNRAMAGYLL